MSDVRLNLYLAGQSEREEQIALDYQTLARMTTRGFARRVRKQWAEKVDEEGIPFTLEFDPDVGTGDKRTISQMQNVAIGLTLENKAHELLFNWRNGRIDESQVWP